MTLLNMDDKYNIQVILYIGTVPLNLVDDKRYVYTSLSYLKAQLLRKVQWIIGRPATNYYNHYVTNNDMIYCSVSLSDVNVA